MEDGADTHNLRNRPLPSLKFPSCSKVMLAEDCENASWLGRFFEVAAPPGSSSNGSALEKSEAGAVTAFTLARSAAERSPRVVASPAEVSSARTGKTDRANSSEAIASRRVHAPPRPTGHLHRHGAAPRIPLCAAYSHAQSALFAGSALSWPYFSSPIEASRSSWVSRKSIWPSSSFNSSSKSSIVT